MTKGFKKTGDIGGEQPPVSAEKPDVAPENKTPAAPENILDETTDGSPSDAVSEVIASEPSYPVYDAPPENTAPENILDETTDGSPSDAVSEAMASEPSYPVYDAPPENTAPENILDETTDGSPPDAVSEAMASEPAYPVYDAPLSFGKPENEQAKIEVPQYQQADAPYSAPFPYQAPPAKKSKKGLIIALSAVVIVLIAAAAVWFFDLFGVQSAIMGRSETDKAVTEERTKENKKTKKSGSEKPTAAPAVIKTRISEFLPNAKPCALTKHGSYSIPADFEDGTAQFRAGDISAAYYIPKGMDAASMTSGGDYVVIGYSSITSDMLESIVTSAFGSVAEALPENINIGPAPAFSETKGVGDYFEKYMTWIKSAAKRQSSIDYGKDDMISIDGNAVTINVSDVSQKIEMAGLGDHDAFLSLAMALKGGGQSIKYRIVEDGDTAKMMIVIYTGTSSAEGAYSEQKREAEYALTMFD